MSIRWLPPIELVQTGGCGFSSEGVNRWGARREGCAAPHNFAMEGSSAFRGSHTEARSSVHLLWNTPARSSELNWAIGAGSSSQEKGWPKRSVGHQAAVGRRDRA